MALAANRAEVDKDIIPVVTGDKAKSLAGIKPLYGA